MVETIGAIKCNFELKAHTIKGNKGISMGHNKSALNFFQNSPFKWKSLWKNLNSCGLKSKTHPDFAAEISNKKSVLLSSNYGKYFTHGLALSNLFWDLCPYTELRQEVIVTMHLPMFLDNNLLKTIFISLNALHKSFMDFCCRLRPLLCAKSIRINKIVSISQPQPSLISLHWNKHKMRAGIFLNIN